MTETKTAEPKPQTRLIAVSFVHSVSFAGESMSVRIQSEAGPRGQANIVDGICPARLEADGSPVAIDKGQLATGVLLRKKSLNGGAQVRQSFVPFANVKELQYGE